MIRTIRSKGPYRIAGWSFGGLLAYEIAVQLIAAGEEVDFVGLLDTSYPGVKWKAERPATIFDDKEMFLLAIESLIRLSAEPDIGEEQRPAFTELMSKSAAMEFDCLVTNAQHMSLVPSTWRDLTPAQVRQILLRAHSFHLATLRYSAQCIPVPVYLFLAEQNADAEPFRGWRECLPEGQIRAIITLGTHHSMMWLPHIKALGQALSTAIHNISKS
jgi:arthrofactin-type cyclic lipopeptide synthetase C